MLTSDNGCVTAQSTCRNTPLRGGKGMLHEGGVRVPFIVSWPGVLPAGQDLQPGPPRRSTCSRPSSAPRAAARYRNPRLDGVDLVPFLTGRVVRDPHPYLFWGTRLQGTVRAENHEARA